MLCVSACAQPRIVSKPEIVEIVRWQLQPVPAELLAPMACPGIDAVQTNQDLVNAYQACWAANEAHNVDKEKIGGLAPGQPPDLF